MNEPTRHPEYEVLPPEDEDPIRRGRRRLVSPVRRRWYASRVLAGVVLVGAWFAYGHRQAVTAPEPASGDHPATAPFRVVQTLLPSEAPRLLVYPYSVIPGGVRSRAELVSAIQGDRVVAEHYATFDTGRARPVQVGAPRRVHVSYRVGGRVYWTRRKIALHPGELLLSDGRHEVRARCGNRVADEVMGETSPLEPSDVVLETPVLKHGDQPSSVLQPLQVYGLFAANGGMPPLVDGGSSIAPDEGPGSPLPGYYGGLPGSSGPTDVPNDTDPSPSHPAGPPHVYPPPDEPPGPPDGPPGPPESPDPPYLPGPQDPPGPSTVPEPATLSLLAAGCAFLFARGFGRRR